jgi:urease accessory protein UreF
MALLLLDLGPQARQREQHRIGWDCCVKNMFQQTKHAPFEALELLGDAHPLLEQLGSAEGLVTLDGAAESLRVQRVDSVPTLRAFLRDYHGKVLRPVELPVIQRAFSHASRGELRELIELDHEVSREPVLRSFAGASRRVGRAQLQRLRPLRDQRVVQRYLAAVDEGRAHGWHTLVYGVTLAVYSLPLRQGLFGYAQQTTGGFIRSAAGSFKFSEKTSHDLFQELCASLPAAIEPLLSSGLAA